MVIVLVLASSAAATIFVLAAVRAGARALPSPQDPGWPRHDVPPDERTAAHEAGHAILAWVSPNVSRLTAVTLDDKDGDAVVRFDRRPLVTPADRWDSIVIALAGIAGEGRAFGSIKAWGAGRDLHRARLWAEELAAAGDPMAAWLWEEPRAASTLDVGAMYKDRPSPLACDVLNKGFRRAKDVIALRPDKFDALRAALRQRRSLTHDEVGALLGPRPWSRT
ncbi:MAG TPA: hypothetical protein VL426_05505 [Candidatus Binatia bacterium]|jgi:hypothetical protein|nr:hypothetical protein [Candidatus Binatia bacterium]